MNVDEISIDEAYAQNQRLRAPSSGLKHLPHWPSVNIEFEDLVYSVVDGAEGIYIILFIFHSNISL
jgi:hypothetical protein